MNRTERSPRLGGSSEHGLVGKAAVIWLLIAAVLVVAALDVVSIGRGTFRLSEIAIEAASDGVTAFRTEGRNAAEACEAVAISLEAQDRELNLGRNGCRVDAETGRVTVTLKATADTVVLGRFGPTEHYAHIVVVETNGPASV